MNSFLALGAFAFLASRPLFAAEPGSDRLREANQLYESSRFEEAIAAYSELAKAAPPSATVHFNLGNAHFRSGGVRSLGRAIASYERAFRIHPRDADIRHNYDFALQRAGESLIPSGTPAALFLLYHLLSWNEILALQWLGFWASLLLASLYLLQESRQASMRPWLAGAALFWASTAAWLGLHWSADARAPGVILTQDAEVRSGPGEKFPVSFKVPEGRRVTTLDSRGAWIEIGVLKEGLKGWIEKTHLERI